MMETRISTGEVLAYSPNHFVAFRSGSTASAILLGLLPIMWSHGTGADVMKRIAAPMIGGMVTTTVLTLLVIPALYFIWRSRSLNLKRSLAYPGRIK